MRVFAGALAVVVAAATASAMEPLARMPLGPSGAMAKHLDDVPFMYCYRGAGGSLQVGDKLPGGASWLARMRYTDEIVKNGWSFMTLEGRESSNDTEVAFASGEASHGRPRVSSAPRPVARWVPRTRASSS